MSHSEILEQLAEVRAEARAVAEELQRLCAELQRKLDQQASMGPLFFRAENSSSSDSVPVPFVE